MSTRRTMGGVILNESISTSPSAVGSPLRRKSLAAPLPPSATAEKSIIQNDDESEILARRRQERPLDNSRALETSERRLSFGFVPGLSGNEIVAHYNQCIKLCAENKITSKNVFALSMIDYMAVLTRRDTSSNNMQTAGTTLDVSAKIYGLRVDCVHTDIIKMAGEKTEQKKQREDGAERQDEAEEPEVRQKKKRTKLQKIIGTEENLIGTLETINLCSKTNYSDSQTTDMLLLVTLPIHASSGHNLHLWEDVLFDKGKEVDAVYFEVEFTAVENLEELDICSSFKDFSITNWSVDDVPDSPTPPQSPVQGGFTFDADTSLVDEGDNDNAGMNYFDLENASQENVDRCERRGREEPDNIVDFRVSVAEDPKDKTMDYSYLQKSINNCHWSGPGHWRPKLTTKSLGGSRMVGACRQEGMRKKKEQILEYDNESFEDFTFKLRSKYPKKLQHKTVRQTWHEDKLSLPEDIHYDNSNPCKFYLHSMAMRPFRKKNKLNEEAEVDVAQDRGEANYDYNNLNDTQDYCSQNNAEEDGGDNVNGFGDRDNGDEDLDQEENENPFGDIYTQGYIGENLVAQPKFTQQISIQYSTRAKKVDMRQLKRSIWKALTIRNGFNEEGGESERNAVDGEIAEGSKFSTVYKRLPSLLGKNNTEALSPALAFSSLLHLANEKSLQITSIDDLSDLKISHGSKPV